MKGPRTPFAPAVVLPLAIDSWVAASVPPQTRFASNAGPTPLTWTVGAWTVSPSAGWAITFGLGVVDGLGESGGGGSVGEALAGARGPVELGRAPAGGPAQRARGTGPGSPAGAGPRVPACDARAVGRFTSPPS